MTLESPASSQGGNGPIRAFAQVPSLSLIHIFDILEEVSKRLPGFPIVLHGASSVIPSYVDMINQYGGNMPGAQGVPEEMLRKAATMAVCKINIDSDLRLAFTGEIRKHLAEHPDHFDPRQYLTDARNGIREMVRHKIVNVLGCNGKA